MTGNVLWRGETEIDGQAVKVRIEKLSAVDLVVLCDDERYPDGHDGLDSDETCIQVYQIALLEFAAALAAKSKT